MWWFRDRLEDGKLDRLLGGRWDGDVWFEVERVSTRVVWPGTRAEVVVAFWWRLPWPWMMGSDMDPEALNWRTEKAPSVWVEVTR